MNETVRDFVNELRIRQRGGHEGVRELEIMCGKAAHILEDMLTLLDNREKSIREVRDEASRAREDSFKRGGPGHPDNDMGM